MDLNTIKSIEDVIANKILKELLEPNSAIVNLSMVKILIFFT